MRATAWHRYVSCGANRRSVCSADGRRLRSHVTEPLAAERDRAGILQCRARVADAHAHVALIDEIVSRAEQPLVYAGAVHEARLRLEGALGKLDDAVADVIAVVQALS